MEVPLEKHMSELKIQTIEIVGTKFQYGGATLQKIKEQLEMATHYRLKRPEVMRLLNELVAEKKISIFEDGTYVLPK